ncbi:chromosome partitioning protein [Streptomyces filamentosus]
MSDATRLAMPALPHAPGDRLEVVSTWNTETPYQSWRPQILVPASFRPAVAPVTYVVVNQKGGAGKTTTTVELAAALAATDLRVRVIDADHQEAALSRWLVPQYPAGEPQRSLRSVFFDECALAEATYPTLFAGVDIVPSGLDLMRVEYERPIGAEQTLAAALARETEQHGGPLYDVTIIDAAPSLGLVTVAGLTAADRALVPLGVGGLDLLGLQSLHRTIRTVQDKTNPKLSVAGVFLTAWDKSGFARQIAERVALDYPEAVVVPVRRSVRAAEAPIAAQPVRLYAPESATGADYAQAAGILLAGEMT